jgi:enterochelin esterase family protein
MPLGKVVFETIPSFLLRDNPLGDPTDRLTPIYLPPGYEESNKRFPVVYLLSGFGGRGTMLLNDSLWDENIARRMDRLISSGQVRPMILALPDCSTRIGGSQYLNSSAVGPYEDYLTTEVVRYVDAHFRTLADRDHRGVLGKSSGGYGALVLSMRHPDLFGLAASHSGDAYFEYCYKPDIPTAIKALPRYGGAVQLLQDLTTIHPKDGTFMSTLNIVAMSACYSPDPDSLYGFDLPFDEQTGELLPAVWQRWLAWDPVEMAPNYKDALRSLRLLFFDAGLRDEFNLQIGARVLGGRLSALGIPFVHEEFDDGHMGISYRYDASLSAISKAMP